ncbi:MAG: hypothetical protein JW751_14430 [Polyangiaceae bacterium]|nr:hypothetical protein [Polyangiaceae bacterium]
MLWGRYQWRVGGALGPCGLAPSPRWSFLPSGATARRTEPRTKLFESAHRRAGHRDTGISPVARRSARPASLAPREHATAAPAQPRFTRAFLLLLATRTAYGLVASAAGYPATLVVESVIPFAGASLLLPAVRAEDRARRAASWCKPAPRPLRSDLECDLPC